MKKFLTITTLIALSFTLNAQRLSAGWETGDILQGIFLPYSLPYTSYSGYPNGYSARIDSSVFRKGRKSVRFEVRQTDSAVGGNSRSELYYSRLPAWTDTLDKFATSLYLPVGYAFDSKGEEFIQYHQPGGASPAWGIGVQADKMYLYINFDSAATGTQIQFVIDLSTVGSKAPVRGSASSGTVLSPVSIKKGGWADFATYYKRSTGASGIFRLYWNKTLVFERYGANYNKIMVGGVAVDEAGGYIKLGCYKYPWNSGTTTSDVSVRVLYQDEFKAAGVNTPMSAMFLANDTPAVNAGVDKSLDLPATSSFVTGAITDNDGYTLLWSKISGPTCTITSPTNLSTTITTTVAGTYIFKLTATDTYGLSRSDTMQIVVNAANVIPIVDAGSDIILTLPLDSITLVGTASDIDGSISLNTWSKFDGGAYTIVSPSLLTTKIRNLTVGIYTLALTVTDNKGATARDYATITVLAANTPPVVNAGVDTTITLPDNSVMLVGTATDNGSIVSKRWTQLTGEVVAILSPDSLQTSVLGFAEGTYSFKLVATDDKGLSTSDTIVIIVLPVVVPPSNSAPIINMVSTVTIQLPIGHYIITPIVGDLDGTVVSSTWNKISGPSTYTITSTTTSKTRLQGLVEGTYIFSLTVVDNDGATSTAFITVKVLKARPYRTTIGTIYKQ